MKRRCIKTYYLVEELDTMYLLRIDPRQSSKWVVPPMEELVTTEKLVRGESGATGTDVEHYGGTRHQKCHLVHPQPTLSSTAVTYQFLGAVPP